MVKDKSRSMHFQTLFEHFTTMKLNVYFLLLALSVYATPELMTAVQEILNSTKIIRNFIKDDPTFRISIPVHQNKTECASIIFKGIDRLKTHPEMREFSNFFLNLKTIKSSLQKNMKTQESCDTESVTVRIFISKLEHFIKTKYLPAKHSK